MCTFFITNLHHHPPSSLLSKESWGWKFTSRLSGLHIWSCLPPLSTNPSTFSSKLFILLNKRDLRLLKLFLNYTLSNNSWAGKCCIFSRLPFLILPDLAMPSNHTWQISAMYATSPTCGLPTTLSKIQHSGSEKYVSSFIGARIKEMGDHCSLSMV